MNNEQTTPTNVNVPIEQPSEKQVWETPELRVIEIEDTASGALPGDENDTASNKS